MPLPVYTHGPSAIFAAPVGLLGFLDTKAVGQNPNKLNEVVQPTLDLWPFYLYGQPVLTVTGTIAPVAIGYNTAAGFQVPTGKAWIPLTFCILNEPGGATDQLDAVPAVAHVQAPTQVVWTHNDSSSGASATSGRRQIITADWWRNPMLVGPGHTFGAYTRFIVLGVGPTTAMTLRYVEFDI